ncbi:MAG: hypothetical protein JSS81_15580 [Acidobacteria bacterium]|nr:hypothetical protein [Acidobacteriota bacterium]
MWKIIRVGFLCFAVMTFSCAPKTENNSVGELPRNKISAPSPCGSVQEKPSAKPKGPCEGRGKYNRLLQQIVSIDSTVFIGDQTIAPPDSDALSALTDVDRETIDDFIEKNKTSNKLTGYFDVYAKVELFEVRDSVEAALQNIKIRFPKSAGLIRLSAIGTNGDRSQTLIYVEIYDLSGRVKKQFGVIRSDADRGDQLTLVPVN